MHDQWTSFDKLSPDKFMTAMSSSGSKNADGDCKLAVEALQDSNLSSKGVSNFVYNKVAFFSLSKFQYISDSLHSCTNRQNIQPHCFDSLALDPLETTASKPHNEISISVNFWVLSVHQVNVR